MPSPLCKIIGIKRSPPGPILQAINAIIHYEPLSSILYGFYWCIFLLIFTPLAFVFLQLQMIIRIVLYYWNKKQKQIIKNFDPRNNNSNNNNNIEMAIVITGCGKGFGKEIAFYAANMGYTVFAGCNRIESLIKECNVLPDRLIPVQMDVTNNEQVQDVVKQVRIWIKDGNNNNNNNKQRVLHALVNNAGRIAEGMIDWCSMEDYKNVMEVNYYGLIRCTKAFLPILKEQAILRKHIGGMRIINMTSIAGAVPGCMGFSPYTGSKCAANSFSSALRQELKCFNIQVSTICPSFHGTNIVHTLDDEVDKIWDNMNGKTKKEYGEEYFKQFCFLVSYIPQMITWNANVVVEKVIECLVCKTLPAEVYIGSDTRFSFLITRIIPAWCFDLLLSFIQPTTQPAAMITKKV